MNELLMALDDSFPFIRSFLSDEIDAAIVYMLSEKKINKKDLAKINGGLHEALVRLTVKYTHKVPTSDASPVHKQKIYAYEKEAIHCVIVHSVAKMLVHIKALTSTVLTNISDSK